VIIPDSRHNKARIEGWFMTIGFEKKLSNFTFGWQFPVSGG
jgi:hypothetical protein